MSAPTNQTGGIGRREFLAGLSAAAAMSAVGGGGALAAAEPAGMPRVQFGRHRISRLIAGHNPIAGFSYQGHHMDRHMRDFFTVDKIVEFLQGCEQQGIDTFQFSWLDKTVQAIQSVRQRGSKMQIVCLLKDQEQVKPAVEAVQPIGITHHGQVTDALFAEGKSQVVRDFCKKVRDSGVMAGVSAHNPDCIKRIADEGWDVDFFMTCFYFITRTKLNQEPEKAPKPVTLDIAYTFLKEDPITMTKVMRQVKQPCLGYKILGAGRLCESQEQVRQAFKFAFENIKPIDSVIVGMYPRFFDEIRADAGYARELGRVG